MQETHAAIDLGSNSFHLIIARKSADEVRIIDRLRERVRLGEGLGTNPRFSSEVLDRAFCCLDRFRERLESVPPTNIRAVGTHSFRCAPEEQQIRIRCEQHLGHPIDVISGVEEARLIWRGSSSSFPQPDATTLLIDIGGGSTELALGQGREAKILESLDRGCVQMMKDHFQDGKITRHRYSQALLSAKLEIEPHVENFRRRGWNQVVGTSGSILAHARILEKLDGNGIITRVGLKKLRDKILQYSNVDEIDLPQLSTDRKVVLLGGHVLLVALMESLDLKEINGIPGGLREGLLAEVVGKQEGDDIRHDSIISRLGFHAVDLPQARSVEKTALSILSAIKHSWELTRSDHHDWLRWASLLHEIGLSVSHDAHPRHGEYLIRNGEFPGLSRNDQQVIASLVRNQRRKLTEQRLAAISWTKPQEMTRLLVIFRLAVLLHRSRSQELIRFEVEGEKEKIALYFRDDWLDDKPLTRAMLHRESDILQQIEIDLHFADRKS